MQAPPPPSSPPATAATQTLPWALAWLTVVGADYGIAIALRHAHAALQAGG